MIERSTPRKLTSTHHIEVQISTREQGIHLTLPLPWMASDLLIWLVEAERLGNEEITAAGAVEDDAREWRMAGVSRRYEALIEGRLVGLLWAHRDWDLHQLEVAHESPEAMGLAVYQELYDGGWSREEITALAQGAIEVLVRATANRVPKAKVDRLVLFGGAEDSRITPGFRPDSNTSATPGGST